MTTTLTVDALAQELRRLGISGPAGCDESAKALMPWIASHAAPWTNRSTIEYLLSLIDAACEDGYDLDEDGPLVADIRSSLASPEAGVAVGLPSVSVTENSVGIENRHWIEIKCHSSADMHAWTDAISTLRSNPVGPEPEKATTKRVQTRYGRAE